MDIDTRTDVYALGVMLYELLTGSPPIDAKQFQRGAILEMLRMVREVDPPRPSTKLSTDEALPNIAANRSIEPARLAKLLQGELDWVVMKALEKDRTRRYETANGLARDIQRYLADEVVEARPPSAGYRLKKFVRRNPLQLALAGTVALLLLGSVAVAWWQNEQASARRETTLRRQLEDDRRAAAENARLSRNSEAVNTLLIQCEEALRAGDAAKAAVALDAARKRSVEGGAAEQANHLARLESDLTLSRDLDAVDQFRWTPVVVRFPDAAAVATRIRGALTRFVADPHAVVAADDVAARVSASVVRERIVSALDRLFLPIHFADAEKRPAKEQKEFTPQLRADVAELLTKTAGVRAVLRLVDADRFRDAVRDAVLAAERAKIEELAQQKAALEQPSGFVAFLCESQALTPERARPLLHSALSQRPGDLGLLMTLCAQYPPTGKDWVDERLRWCQAAVAAAPTNAAAHANLALTLSVKGEPDEAIVCYRKALELEPKQGRVNVNLGCILCDAKGDYDGAIACFQKAIELDPNLVEAQINLGVALSKKNRFDEAIACFRKAIQIDPKFPKVHAYLGSALGSKGLWNEAIAYSRKAIEIDPKLVEAQLSLAFALRNKGQWNEAITCYRTAIELDPKLVEAQLSLAFALRNKGLWNEAITCYRKAIELDPKRAEAHNALGGMLSDKQDYDGAIACFRKAIELDPNDAKAQSNLGAMLCDYKRDYDGAIACFRKAIELDPKDAGLLFNLGNALSNKGQLDEAIACYKKAIEFDPKGALAHYNLGNSLRMSGKNDEAIECYRNAIALNPTYAEAHCNLGSALASEGRFAESMEAFKRGHELGTKRPNWRFPSADWVRRAEASAAMEAKLPGFLSGQFQPRDNQERMGLAGVCAAKKLHRAAAGLYAAAFAADPKLADGVHPGNRFDAACAAARAGTVGGQDEPPLDDLEKARWRKQALDWLREHLAMHARQLEDPKERGAVPGYLRAWQTDAPPGIRDEAALAKLPEEEQKAWSQLWADVAELLKKSSTPGLASLLEQLAEARNALPKDSPQLASLLNQIGLSLLQQKKWIEADRHLRESLAIREKKEPDDWQTFNTTSLLGGALLGQKKYAEAEPLLRKGYEGMKQREKTIPPEGRVRLAEALDRLVDFYTATNKPDEVRRWRAERVKYPEAEPAEKK
jgi:tetratricopeptide (TPR) repeat protein